MNSQQNEHSGKWRHLFEVLVAVDVFAFGGVLKPVGLDVLPQSVDDDRPSLGVNAQQTRQTQIQFELHRLKPHRSQRKTSISCRRWTRTMLHEWPHMSVNVQEMCQTLKPHTQKAPSSILYMYQPLQMDLCDALRLASSVCQCQMQVQPELHQLHKYGNSRHFEHTQPFNGLFVRNYAGKPVREETFTHSHPS